MASVVDPDKGTEVHDEVDDVHFYIRPIDVHVAGLSLFAQAMQKMVNETMGKAAAKLYEPCPRPQVPPGESGNHDAEGAARLPRSGRGW